ncbi:Alpha/Beta hydrolase protein [Dichotomocladium elegans]|nr:Alpha/Beta hydrolase protein [Dichotomocladium elegans]
MKKQVSHASSLEDIDGPIFHPICLKYGWVDNALDTIQVIETLELKKTHSKVIGVGHSFGGSSMIIAEFLYPNTFDGLCILEAVIHNNSVPRQNWINFPPIKMTLQRRDTWPNREACFKSFNGRPFWKDFHPEALQNYVNYGLYEDSDGTVKLKCPKEQEYLVYLDGHLSSTVTYHGLKTVTIPVHMVHARSSSFTDPATATTIKNLSPSITSATVDGSHVVVLENPDSLVPEIVYLTNRVLSTHAKL